MYSSLCYSAFGELFFREAQTDPIKLDLAVAAYKEVLKPSDTRTVGSPVVEKLQLGVPPFLALIAHYRLEQVYGMKLDCNKATLEHIEIDKIKGPGLDAPCARTIIANASLERAAGKCVQPPVSSQGLPKEPVQVLAPR